MNESWRDVTLGDIFEISSSKRVHEKDWKSSGVPFYRAREIVTLAREGHVRNDLFISEEMYSEYRDTFGVPRAGDLMVSAVGTLGACYVVQPEDRFYYKDASVLRFSPKTPVCSEFFAQAFRTNGILDQVHAGSGSTVGTYTISRAKQTRISIPPLSEQCRIAAILGRADGLRAKRRAAFADLSQLMSSVFLDMFGDPVKNERRWDVRPYADLLVAPLRNGLSPSNSGGVQAKVLTLSAVTGDSFDESAVKTSFFKAESPDNQRVNVLDFLVCRGNGNPKLVGKGHFPVRSLPDTTFPDTMIAGRIDHAKVHPDFLEAAWTGENVRAQIEKLARTTNGTYKINQPMLEGVQLFVPPRDLQEQFARRITALRNVHSTFARSEREYDSLFESLQHHAFTGSL